MLTAEYISDRISDFVQSEIKVYSCNNLRASNIGYPCERYLYLLIRHYCERDRWASSMKEDATSNCTGNWTHGAGIRI